MPVYNVLDINQSPELVKRLLSLRAAALPRPGELALAVAVVAVAAVAATAMACSRRPVDVPHCLHCLLLPRLTSAEVTQNADLRGGRRSSEGFEPLM